MKACPECGSTEIMTSLEVITYDLGGERHTMQVVLQEPEPKNHPFFWMPRSVATGFHAEICGACGHTQLYAKHPSELLEVYKKGYVSRRA